MSEPEIEPQVVAAEILDLMDPELPPEAQIAEEAAAVKLAEELHNAEVIRRVADGLIKFGALRHPGFSRQAEGESIYDTKALIESPSSVLDLFAERLLEGKNPAIVVRAGRYENFSSDILEPLKKIGSFGKVEVEQFPHPTNTLGHSRIHLDNFADEKGSHFRYGMTVSRTDKGSVLFIAGLASDAVYGWPKLYYEHVHQALNNSNHIQGLEERATDRIAPRGVSRKEWHQPGRGLKGQFIATTLAEGDVVIWPQGGPGAELPAWHGFVQIGNPKNPHFVPRQSTSYHLSR